MLELGGKNPTIVHSSANLKVAARRIAYGRFLNSGHICTAPDHVLVWPEVKDDFIRHLTETIREFYGEDPKASPDYGRVINRRNFDRLVGADWQRQNRSRRPERPGRTLHCPDRARGRHPGFADHARGSVWPDPPSAGD